MIIDGSIDCNMQAAEGEKDPRNLVNIFNCSSFILDNFNVDHLREDIFESLAVYFPIGFQLEFIYTHSTW